MRGVVRPQRGENGVRSRSVAPLALVSLEDSVQAFEQLLRGEVKGFVKAIIRSLDTMMRSDRPERW